MDTKTKNCKVTIFGDCYSLVTTESEEHLKQAAFLVDEIMQEIATKSIGIEEKKVAILTALRIASKALLLEDEIAHKKNIEKKLIDKIDQEISVLQG